MNQEEKVLEIDKIKQEWSDYAMTETVKGKKSGRWLRSYRKVN